MKPTTANVVDFLSRWPLNTGHFATVTLCRDFNMVCHKPATESQMSGILSGLTIKGVMVRIGRGIYSQVNKPVAPSPAPSPLRLKLPAPAPAPAPVPVPPTPLSIVKKGVKLRLATPTSPQYKPQQKYVAYTEIDELVIEILLLYDNRGDEPIKERNKFMFTVLKYASKEFKKQVEDRLAAFAVMDWLDSGRSL
jgi:hypothetical protein